MKDFRFNRFVIVLILLSVLLAGCGRVRTNPTPLPESTVLPSAVVPGTPDVTQTSAAIRTYFASFPLTETARPSATATADLLRTRFAGLPLTQTAQPLAAATATRLPPTAEPSYTPLPTITPMLPTPPVNQAYRLTDWTPEKAEKLIAELKNYPETLNIILRGRYDSGYDYSFRYAGLAELESALHFPQVERKQIWQWDGAYQLFGSGNNDAANVFANLVVAALNQNEISLDKLDARLEEFAPFDVERYPIRPPAGYQNSLVLYLNESDEYNDGGFAIWLVEKGGVYLGYALGNKDYAIEESIFEAVDITGDGIAEAILRNTHWGSFGSHYGALTIFRLDQVPPQPVQIMPALFEPDSATWSVEERTSVPTITFHTPSSTYSDMPCGSFIVDMEYQWRANELELVRITPPPLDEMEEQPHCVRALVWDLEEPRFFENRVALAAYQALLDLPVIEQGMVEWERFQIEEKRLNVAIFLSDHGYQAGADAQIQKIRASTEADNAQWRKDALAFYTARGNLRTLFQFCLESKACDTFLDYDEILAAIPPERYSELETLLAQTGFKVQAAGNYDFDLDGQKEKWLVFKNQYGCNGEFWILADRAGVIERRMVDTICIVDPDKQVDKIEIKPDGMYKGFPSYRLAADGEANILFYPFLYWPIDK